jgi:hypothetical protein
MSDDDTCAYEWRDGWGEHRCLRATHDDPSHHCECDATTYEPTDRDRREVELPLTQKEES